MSFIPRRHCFASAPTNRILSIYPYQNGSRRIESTVDGDWPELGISGRAKSVEKRSRNPALSQSR